MTGPRTPGQGRRVGALRAAPGCHADSRHYRLALRASRRTPLDAPPGDPVCPCGHGLSVHAVSSAATSRACQACRSLVVAGLRTPTGEPAAATGDRRELGSERRAALGAEDCAEPAPDPTSSNARTCGPLRVPPPGHPKGDPIPDSTLFAAEEAGLVSPPLQELLSVAVAPGGDGHESGTSSYVHSRMASPNAVRHSNLPPVPPNSQRPYAGCSLAQSPGGTSKVAASLMIRASASPTGLKSWYAVVAQ